MRTNMSRLRNLIVTAGFVVAAITGTLNADDATPAEAGQETPVATTTDSSDKNEDREIPFLDLGTDESLAKDSTGVSEAAAELWQSPDTEFETQLAGHRVTGQTYQTCRFVTTVRGTVSVECETSPCCEQQSCNECCDECGESKCSCLTRGISYVESRFHSIGKCGDDCGCEKCGNDGCDEGCDNGCDEGCDDGGCKFGFCKLGSLLKCHGCNKGCCEGRAYVQKRPCHTGCDKGCCGKGCPPFKHYQLLYAVNPGYFDQRDGRVYASMQTGVPMAVPLAPNVNYTYNYSWGIPSSRLTPISRVAPNIQFAR